ncbi:transposase [Archangium violaceum]|uniref:transposase n=1 Tax=Archangium violaceum TaxID=83451 RepID=UPI0037C0F174
MCRQGARGALALERLSRAQDGRIAYRMKRPLPDGATLLFFTGLELLRPVASLVPPPRTNLTRFHGVFAPGAKLRPFLIPLTEVAPKEQEASAPPEAAAKAEPKKERTPRLSWAGLLRRMFVLDVLACAGCGGRIEGVGGRDNTQRGARLSGAPGSAHAACTAGPGAGATPKRMVLSQSRGYCSQLPCCPHPVPRPSWEGGLG